jgi:hypothetical protein
MRRTIALAALAVAALFLAACGGTVPSEAPDVDAPVGVGMCAPDVPDCDDMIVLADNDAELRREDAQALLGMTEGELPDDVRIARRGDEQLMLTQDYVVGRITVELDDLGGGFEVVSATLELEEGQETFTR